MHCTTALNLLISNKNLLVKTYEEQLNKNDKHIYIHVYLHSRLKSEIPFILAN